MWENILTLTPLARCGLWIIGEMNVENNPTLTPLT